jgi:hypothetical protein
VEGAPWVRYLISKLYSSIAFALAQNKEFMTLTSAEYQFLIKTISGTKPTRQTIKDFENLVRFAFKKSARMVHHSAQEFNIVPSTREEIEFLHPH